MKELKDIIAQLIAGEPTGLAGFLIAAAAFLACIGVIGWTATRAANLYGAMRYRDAEQRRKYLEGDQ